MTQRNSLFGVAILAFLVLATSRLLFGCASEGPGEASVEQAEEAITTVSGGCTEPTLDFQELARWSRVSGTAPTADDPGKGTTGKGLLFVAGTHTVQATFNPLAATWVGTMKIALRATSQGGAGTGFVTATLTAPNTAPIAFTRTSFSTSTTDWTIPSITIPVTAKQAALAAQGNPVTISLKFETTRPLRVDELRFGSLVCSRCSGPLPAQDPPAAPLPVLPGNSTPTDVAFRIPAALSMAEIALGADRTLDVGNSAKVLGMATGTFGTVTNVGDTLTNVRLSATVGDVQTIPDLTLTGTIDGDLIREENMVLQPSGRITGTQLHRDIPVQEVRWTAHLPNTDSSTLTVAQGQTTELPLQAGTVQVNGTLTVKPGSYVASSFKLLSPGVMNIDNASGDVFLYVKSTFELKSTVNLTDPNRNNVVFVYLGTPTLTITSPQYTGVVIAPNADVEFDKVTGQFRGSVFARRITLQSGNTFRFQHYYPLCNSDAIHVCGTSKPGCSDLRGCEALACQPEPGHEAVANSCYATADEPVWGFADLHAHPASELGWGYDGSPGMFVGQTGLDPDQSFSPMDCNVDTHSGELFDPVKSIGRPKILAEIESQAGFAHTRLGTTGVGSWPSARSVVHQQMRIDWVKRAFQGGLRLMFAAVADNRMLHSLWQQGFGSGDVVPPDYGPTNAQWDLQRAEPQLAHIENLVAHNSSWMEIVDSPASARAAIKNGKLAVVLSLEMDSLDLATIKDLKSRHKIGHVIPIHLADNAWGGTAVYSELFEGNSWFLNKKTRIALEHSPLLTYHLPNRSSLKWLVAYVDRATEPLSEADACRPLREGHKNALGLTSQGKLDMEGLMEEGLFIDLSHMGDKSTDDTIALLDSSKFRYPLMSSHTGIQSHEGGLSQAEKGAHGPMLRERELTKEQARRIGASGGVIGLGTAGDITERVLADISGGEAINLASPDSSFTWQLRDRSLFPESTIVTYVDVRLRAGYDGKRECNDVTVRVLRRSGAALIATALGNRVVEPYTWSSSINVPIPNLPLSEITGIQIDYRADDPCLPNDPPDEFAVTGIDASFRLASGKSGVLVQRTASSESQGGRNGYYFLFKQGNSRLVENLRWSQDERFLSEEIKSLRVRYVFTGGFIKRGQAKFVIETSDRCFSPEFETPLVIETPGAPKVDNEGSFDFTPYRQSNGSPYTVADVLKVTLSNTYSRIESLTLEAVTQSGTYELVTRRGSPFVEYARTNVVLYEPPDDCRRLSPDEPVRTVLVHITTGNDRPTSVDPLLVSISKPDSFHVTTALNPSGNTGSELLLPGKVVTATFALPDNVTVQDLYQLDIQATTGWDIDRIRVTIPDDPLQKWSDTYRDAAALTGGRGIALGTDLNGLQHQLAFASQSPSYPFDVPGPSGAPMATLQQHVIGQRALDFRKDGLAHYGMLADMAAALPRVNGGQNTFDRLFRSAEDVIRMWERIEARKVMLALRRSTACVSFGPADTAKSVLGVSCLSLPAATSVPVPIVMQVKTDPPGTLAGDGYLDVYVSNCAVSRLPMRLETVGEWVPVPLPLSFACPVTLRLQGELGDEYEVKWKPAGS